MWLLSNLFAPSYWLYCIGSYYSV